MDPALWERLKRSGTSDEEEEVEAIIRLDRPDVDVARTRLVARFGPIATCRLRLDSILDVRQEMNVWSLKASRLVGAESDWAGGSAVTDLPATVLASDRRRPEDVTLTGAGVVVGFVDWGCDFDHPNFKRPDGSTRLLALWDQRGPRSECAPYGYGTVHTRQDIDRALRSADPYDALSYHPAIADRDGSGAHGCHVMDIAIGNGQAGGPIGIAPAALPAFVHLADQGTGGLANLGDSVRVLEAIDFIARIAGDRPWVINLSVGRHGGPHDGCTLAELALDWLLRAAPGRFVVQSAGNYYDRCTHASGRVGQGRPWPLTFLTHEDDFTPNELEIWYSGEDEFIVRVDPPSGPIGAWVALGDDAAVLEDGVPVGWLYHRCCDPNNSDHQIELFLHPSATAGRWTVILEGVRVRGGVFHAWLERDEACGHCQAHFVDTDCDPSCTTGTLANGRLPLVVGAYDGHSPRRELAHFSSVGPTRDGRDKPDAAAPGVEVLAALSAPKGNTRSPGLLTRKSGTSMAAPHVTGAVALCLQGARRALAADEIRALVLRTAEPVPVAGHLRRAGRGYLDIRRAVSAVSSLGRESSGRRDDPSTRPRPRRPRAEEKEMDAEFEPPIPDALGPARVYREIVHGPGGTRSAWIDERFTVLARPGDRLATAPAAGDVLVRAALGERGPGHAAVLTDSDLIPRPALTQVDANAEDGGPGFYAIVVENGVVPRSAADRFARRILDRAGCMLDGQVLLRPLHGLGSDHEQGGDDREATERQAPPVSGPTVSGRAALARPTLTAADAGWAGAFDSPDHRHLLPETLGLVPFSLSSLALEQLCQLNRFSLPMEAERVLFALRACTLEDDSLTSGWSPSVRLIEATPDHVHARCVLGVWDRPGRRIVAFRGSTVPFWRSMEKYRQGGEKCNMLPTGLYQYRVGTHRPDHRLEIKGALRQRGPVVVLRTVDDLVYEVTDVWDCGHVGDNIHPARQNDTNGFSSEGCLTVPGVYDKRTGVHSGAWADFREAARLTRSSSPRSEEGRPFVLVLLAGRDARLLSSSANPTTALARLRFGSSGTDVVALQIGLQATGHYRGDAGGVMDGNTTLAYVRWQQGVDGGRADAIVTPDDGRALGFDMIRQQSVAPVPWRRSGLMPTASPAVPTLTTSQPSQGNRPALTLRDSVGRGATNAATDVAALRNRLIELGFDWLHASDKVDDDLIHTIKLFQSIIHGRNVLAGDRRVDVPGPTYDWLRAANAPRWQVMPAGSRPEGFENLELADTTDLHDYGTDWLADTIRAAGASYRDNYLAAHGTAALLTVNDTSLPQGGHTDDHAGHQTGLASDLTLPRIDGTAPGNTTWNGKNKALYDRDAARAMLQALRAQPLVARIFFNDDVLIQEGLCSRLDGHDDHIHVQITPPTQQAAAGASSAAGGSERSANLQGAPGAAPDEVAPSATGPTTGTAAGGPAGHVAPALQGQLRAKHSAPAGAPELEEWEGEGEADVQEVDESEDEQEDFGPLDLVKSFFRLPTVGFEFDVHYGPIPALPDSRIGDVLSSHTHGTDGFIVKLDGPRLEVNTRPFETTDAGKKEIKETATRISTFTEELGNGCRNATVSSPAEFPGARPFTHPKVTVPIGKRPIGGKFTNCSVWAAPQATVTIPLRRVATLVERIRASEGDGPGVALTGGSSLRMGLRSEALYRACREVKKARRAAAFSDDLEGFLILFASYLWTSELPYRFPAPGERIKPLVHDYEEIGKAYLPVNMKNPFHQVFSILLSDADKKAFRSRFADGSARANLFKLARPGATVADGTTKFLPPGRTVSGVPEVVHDFQKKEFGFVPTWDDLVEHTLDRTHRGMGDRLWVTHSKPKDISVTSPRVLLELRRAGFKPLDRSQWGPFMLRVHKLTAELNL